MQDPRHNKPLSERLHRVIPGGAHTYSRGDDQFPGNAPPLLKRGDGAYVWDKDDNKFLDYGMALRSVVLGYAHPKVNAGAIKEIENGVGLTRASFTELRAAEKICDLIDSVEMVKFAKNGSNATTAAVKIARAYTHRKYVCVPRQHPFFSFDDWFIGTTAIKRGTLEDHSNTTLVFDYNDMKSLEKLFVEYPDQIAAVMLEPATHITPCGKNCGVQWPAENCASCPNASQNFLHQVRALTKKHEALMILDEMITGFRWDLKGAQHFFGVDPDLCTFGKAMANGFALAAVGGKREFMEVGSIDKPGLERTFLLSSTHGGEMPALGAFLAACEIFENENVTDHLWDYGRKLREGLTNMAAQQGLSDFFQMEGPDIALNYVTRDKDKLPSLEFRTLFAQEMLRHKVMMPWISISLAHQDSHLDQTLEAASNAFKIYAKAIDNGIADYLEGNEIKPVFRTFN